MTTLKDLQSISDPVDTQMSSAASLPFSPQTSQNVSPVLDALKSGASGLANFLFPSTMKDISNYGPYLKESIASMHTPTSMQDYLGQVKTQQDLIGKYNLTPSGQAPAAAELASYVAPLAGKMVPNTLTKSAIAFGLPNMMSTALSSDNVSPTQRVANTALSGTLGTLLGPVVNKLIGPESGYQMEQRVISPEVRSGTESMQKGLDVVKTASQYRKGITPNSMQEGISQGMGILKNRISQLLSGTTDKFNFSSSATGGENNLRNYLESYLKDKIAGFQGSDYQTAFTGLMDEIKNKIGSTPTASDIYDNALQYVGNKNGIWKKGELSIPQEIARETYGGIRSFLSTKVAPELSGLLSQESDLLSYNKGLERMAGIGAKGGSIGSIGASNPLYWLMRIIGNPIGTAELGISRGLESGVPQVTAINKTIQSLVQ